MKTPIIRTVLLRAALLLSTLLTFSPLADAQTTATYNPTYIPTSILAPQTFSAVGNYVFQNQGNGSAVMQVSGTFTGLTATIQGTTLRQGTQVWTTIPYVNLSSSNTSGTTVTAVGTYRVDLSGFAAVRLNITAISTGSVTVGMSASPSTPGSVPANISSGGQLIMIPYADSASSWQATSGVTALATTTSTAMKTAAGAGVRNYLTSLSVVNSSATVSTTVTVLDGATVIWTGYLPALAASQASAPVFITFPVALRGTANTAMNIQLGTAGAAVYWASNGYTGP